MPGCKRTRRRRPTRKLADQVASTSELQPSNDSAGETSVKSQKDRNRGEFIIKITASGSVTKVGNTPSARDAPGVTGADLAEGGDSATSKNPKET